MPTLKKPVRSGDASRKKIYTPSECLVPEISGGFVFVHPKKSSTVRILERKGFVQVVDKPVVTKVKPAAPESKVLPPKLTEREALLQKTVKDLSKIARNLDIPGRSKMNESELVDSIIAARSSK